MYVTPSVITLYQSATGDQGITKGLLVLYDDGDYAGTAGTPANLTGLTPILKVWDGSPSYPLLVSSNVANDGTPTDGNLIWTVSTSDIESLPVSYQGLYAEIQLSAVEASTTAHNTSNAGQKVLTVNATTDFTVGATVVIDSQASNQETCVIASVQSGTSLTMVSNLKYAHLNTEPVVGYTSQQTTDPFAIQVKAAA